MPRCFLLLLLLLGGFAAQARQEFTVDDLSPAYFARIHVDTLFQGWVGVYDRKTQRELIRVEPVDISGGLDGQLLEAAATRIPYAEQHVVVSGDFNFDGRPDLAIQDGRNSCRGNASFQVYLATSTGFAHNEAFTDLAQNYCGMFEVDAARKRLGVQQTGAWGGESTQFSVRNNEPFLVSSSREDQSHHPFVHYSQEEWNGTRLVSKDWWELEISREQEICTFQLAENGKRVVLFAVDSTTLYYVLLRQDESVEFSYPTPRADDKPAFALRKVGTGLSLHFQNGSARYEIRETAAGQQTVTARAGAKTLTLTGAAPGRKGGLRPLLTTKLANLTVQP